ncbi:MAG: NPCBM/NEW2 domain-containing protein [Isosphaeraceae bacterium]
MSNVLNIIAFTACLLAVGFPAAVVFSAPLESTPLGDLCPDSVRQDYGALQVNRSVMNQLLRIGDRTFAHGLGTHASSELVFDLDQSYDRFEATIGVDAEMRSYRTSSVVFIVKGDGRELFRSDVMRIDTPPQRVSVSLAGVCELRLIVSDAGDGINCDHADWAEAVLFSRPRTPEPAGPARFSVLSPTVRIKLSALGQIVGLNASGVDQSIRGGTRLGGCRTVGPVVARQTAGGGLAFVRKLADHARHTCTVTEHFTPAKDSIRWDVEILGDGEPWSAPVITWLTCESPRQVRFWTAWSDPEVQGEIWHDPLASRTLDNHCWHYGNEARGVPTGGDFIAIPLATIAAPDGQSGVSLVHSPDDVLLKMNLATTRAGLVRFSRTGYRIRKRRPVRFTVHLVGHEASWRGGLRWMAAHYPLFFDPPNPRVREMAGCGAYSGDERPIDVAKFKAMAFRINWKLSDDFPYMGMFIPPVKNADERWTRSCDEPRPTGKPVTTSCRQMNDYARWMHAHGFHVLSYFNVTEFGKNMKDAAIPTARAKELGLWKDPVAFLKLRLGNAYLKPPILTCYGAWVTDVGDPAYQEFLLEQAKRHIDLLPDTDGLCIDRNDWLRLDNPAGDDGVSWVDGKPARSLYRSWITFLDRLGPLMHGADKVIFANTMTMRLELTRQLDGIYNEFGNNPGTLNATALLGIHKPILEWTVAQSLHQPGPDTFFQRQLYLGVYPTAPYPFNHHCITPDPAAEEFYLDYGPLLDALRGKRWVLAPSCVSTDTPGVRVNLFEVPGGYVLPVMLGGQTTSAQVRVRNCPGLDKLKCDALHPAEAKPTSVSATFRNKILELDVPLKRGCAMVRLGKAVLVNP